MVVTEGGARMREVALLLLLATLWAASFSLIRVGVATIPPVTFSAGRTVIAAATLWICVALQGIAVPRDPLLWRDISVQGVLNSILPFTLIGWAEQSVPASLAAILNAMTPVFTLLGTALVTRHEAVPLRKAFGAACGVVGVCLLVGQGGIGGIGAELAAPLAVVAASVSYAGAAIFGQRFNGIPALLPAAGSMTCGAVILVPASLLLDRPWALSVSVSSGLALLGLAVFSTALAYVVYFRLIRTLGSVGTTAQAFLRVPIGVALGVLFLGETLSATEWLGGLSVLVGVAAMTLPRRAVVRALAEDVTQ